MKSVVQPVGLLNLKLIEGAHARGVRSSRNKEKGKLVAGKISHRSRSGTCESRQPLIRNGSKSSRGSVQAAIFFSIFFFANSSGKNRGKLRFMGWETRRALSRVRSYWIFDFVFFINQPQLNQRNLNRKHSIICNSIQLPRARMILENVLKSHFCKDRETKYRLWHRQGTARERELVRPPSKGFPRYGRSLASSVTSSEYYFSFLNFISSSIGVVFFEIRGGKEHAIRRLVGENRTYASLSHLTLCRVVLWIGYWFIYLFIYLFFSKSTETWERRKYRTLGLAVNFGIVLSRLASISLYFITPDCFEKICFIGRSLESRVARSE